MVQPLWTAARQFLGMLNRDLPYDPAITLLDVYPKTLKTGTQTDTRMPVFISALFPIAKNWKLPKYPSTDERIDKMWCIHGVEVLIHATTWVNLENIL